MSSWWGITATLAGMAAFGSSAIFFATSRSSPIAPKTLFFHQDRMARAMLEGGDEQKAKQ